MIMYLGKVVELGMIREVIANPLHPYAQALISAVPIPDPSYKRPRPNIKGEVSQPIDLRPAAVFTLAARKEPWKNANWRTRPSRRSSRDILLHAIFIERLRRCASRVPLVLTPRIFCP